MVLYDLGITPNIVLKCYIIQNFSKCFCIASPLSYFRKTTSKAVKNICKSHIIVPEDTVRM